MLDEAGQELRVFPGAEFEVFREGTFWLVGQRNSTNSTSFSLTLNHLGNETPLPFEGEAIVPGVVAAGEISVSGETDLFAFSLESEEVIYIDGLPTSTAEQDFTWSLVTNRGLVSSGNFSESGRRPIRLGAGHYQIMIEHRQAGTGAYSFRLGMLANGEQIEVESTFTTKLAVGSDSQVYRFQANSGDEFLFERISGNGTLAVFDPHQRELFQTNFATTDVFHTAIAGTYTVVLNGYPGTFEAQTIEFVLHQVEIETTTDKPVDSLEVFLGQGDTHNPFHVPR